jgi:adenylylsulfate kinase
MVIWLIGLSGAGKTTVGVELVDMFRAQVGNVVFVDGDAVREIWRDAPGHDVAGRRQNAERISHLCRYLDREGMHVVACVLSIFPEWQAWNRENFSEYFEVFLDVPMDVLQQRDPKGLYARARKGELKNVVGIDIPFPAPPHPDLVVRVTDGTDTPRSVANDVFARATARFPLHREGGK